VDSPFVANDPTEANADQADARAIAHAQSVQDQQTVRQLQRGQWSALDGLVLRYQDRIYATIFRMVNHADDAAELTQETFVRALQNINSFKGASSFYTWLFRIAVNLSLGHRRAQVYRKTTSLDDDGDDRRGGQQASALRAQMAQRSEPSPDGAADVRMEHQRAIAALETLEPAVRALIILRDVENLDYAQIADVLEVPEGTVKSRLFRARQLLRDAMRTMPRRPG
jgi:RNA polymerase sigma-70 factor (ECF subfamily)